MIPTILAIVASLLILGATAWALTWVTLMDRRTMASLGEETASRTTGGPLRVHPADDAVTGTEGRTL